MMLGESLWIFYNIWLKFWKKTVYTLSMSYFYLKKKKIRIFFRGDKLKQLIKIPKTTMVIQVGIYISDQWSH